MPIKFIIHSIVLFFFVACARKQAISESEAIKIAEQELHMRYGDAVLKQKPFKAISSEDKWIISGTLNCPNDEVCSGGVGEVDIDKNTGKILRMTHSK